MPPRLQLRVWADAAAQAGDELGLDFDSRDFTDPAEAREALLQVFDASENLRRPIVLAFLTPVAELTLPEMLTVAIDRCSSMSDALRVDVLVASDDVAAYLSRLLASPSEPAVRLLLPSGTALEIRVANIAETRAEAIVNASNQWLKLGSGVSGAIRRRALPTLQRELDRIAGRRGIGAGDVVVTGSHGLPGVRLIVHAATASGGEGTVGAATTRALEACSREGVKSVAFPALGTGTGGLEMNKCARAMLRSLLAAYSEVHRRAAPPQRVTLVLPDRASMAEFLVVAQQMGLQRVQDE